MKLVFRWLICSLALVTVPDLSARDTMPHNIVIGNMSSMASVADLDRILRANGVVWRTMTFEQDALTITATDDQRRQLETALDSSAPFVRKPTSTAPDETRIQSKTQSNWQWQKPSARIAPQD